MQLLVKNLCIFLIISLITPGIFAADTGISVLNIPVNYGLDSHFNDTDNFTAPFFYNPVYFNNKIINLHEGLSTGSQQSGASINGWFGFFLVILGTSMLITDNNHRNTLYNQHIREKRAMMQEEDRVNQILHRRQNSRY
ncbi:MAG: hypothetical protein FWD40_03335 [Treponema sp.]|nr:hypothetical protein [Treponema sp.]